MSERGPARPQGDVAQADNQSDFNPLQEATRNGDEHRKRYYAMVGDVSEFSDHDTFSTAHKDMADYLSSRPYEDVKGNIHDPENAQFMKKTETEEEYYDRLATTSVESTDQFAGKSLDELAHMVSEAKERGDTTTAKDAEDVFSNKFIAMAEKYGWPDESVSSRLDRFHEIMNSKSDQASVNHIEVSDGSAAQQAVGVQEVAQSGVVPEEGLAESTEERTDSAPNTEGLVEQAEPVASEALAAVQAPSPESTEPAVLAEGGDPTAAEALSDESASEAPEAEQAPSSSETDTTQGADESLTPEEQARLAEIASRGEREPQAGQANPVERALDAAQALARERQMAERQTQLASVEAAFLQNPENGSIIESLKQAQDRYVHLKAKSETWGRWGRNKREVELKEAEIALKSAEITYARSLTEAKAANGLLDSEDPVEKRGLHGEQLFGTLRTLVNERRANVRGLREQQIENPALHMKVLGAVGKFFNGGGKWSRRMKAGGLGVAAGVGTVLSGVGWPITMIASTGVGLGIRGASVVDNLNKQVAGVGVEGADRAIVSDDMFNAFMESFKQSSVAWQDVAYKLSQDAFDVARTQGYENADVARKEANKNMASYGIGFGIGSAATLLTSGILNSVHASGNTMTPHMNEGALPSERYPTPPAPHEFANGADKIANGEGWFHQFRDMGMSTKEAHALFGDDKVMKQLVDAGAAYVDNSSRIGGYGINMPKGGHLSTKAMEIIGRAMAAKGY